MKKKYICFVGFLSLLLALLVQTKEAEANTLDFEITPMLPESQSKKDINYFDLLMEKEADQTVMVNVRNLTDQNRTIGVEINPATTNHHGVVEYTNHEIDETNVPFNIQKAVTVEKKYAIKGNETIDIPIKIKMPKVSYEGIVAGGIRISDASTNNGNKNAEAETGASDENLVIRNKYTYVVALLLRQSNKEVTPELDVGGVAIKALDNKDIVGIELDNLTNTYVHEVRVEAAVKKEGAELSFSEERSNMKLAPRSTMEFPIPVTDKLPAGNYETRVTAYSELDDAGKHLASDGSRYRYKWELQKSFSLEERIIKENTSKKELSAGKNRWLYLLLFLLFTVLFVGIGIILQKNKLKNLKN